VEGAPLGAIFVPRSLAAIAWYESPRGRKAPKLDRVSGARDKKSSEGTFFYH